MLETELRRATTRLGVDQLAVTRVLEGISLYELPPSVYREAGLLPGEQIRTLDALHVVAAIRLDVDAVVAYDARLRTAVEAAGVAVRAPASP